MYFILSLYIYIILNHNTIKLCCIIVSYYTILYYTILNCYILYYDSFYFILYRVCVYT